MSTPPPRWTTSRVVDGAMVVTIDRPPANAIDLQLLDELRAATDRAAESAHIGALIITGTGRFFMAGGDIKLFPELTSEEFGEYVSAAQSTFNHIEKAPVPVIAAVNGYAGGGGFELAMACDLRFMAPTATLSVPEVNIGLFPAAGGTQRLLRAVGKGRSLELLYTGRDVDADEALQLGLAERVVPGDHLLEAAIALGRAFATGPSGAYVAIKDCILTGLAQGDLAGQAAEVRHVVALHASPDGQEGIAAFVERRQPHYPSRKDTP